MSSRTFIFLPMRAMMPRILPSRGTSWTDHLPRPSFSFSAKYAFPLKRGRLLDSLRMWRPKNPPCFCVENEGYPPPPTPAPPGPLPLRPPALFNLDDSHMTGVPLDAVKPLDGLDRPLAMLRPGLAQPPPGTGDGLRDRDIGVVGVPGEEGQRKQKAN